MSAKLFLGSIVTVLLTASNAVANDVVLNKNGRNVVIVSENKLGPKSR